jgi:aflatoxin B1 aldehyde reductase
LIPACRRYGIDVVIFNPLAGGVLAGKYKSAEAPTEGRYADASGRVAAMYRARYFKDATFESLKVIDAAASKHGLSMAEIVLRWCVHHSALKVIGGGHDGIIIGASSISQLDNNLIDLEKGPLPEEVVRSLDEAWMISKASAAGFWHGELEYTYDTQKALFGLKGS